MDTGKTEILVDMDVLQARNLLQEGQHREALPLLERALRRDPGNGAILSDFSATCGTLGEIELETRVLGELAPKATQNAPLLAHYAQALGDLGQFEQSISAFQQALAIDPNQHAIRVAYGMALLRRGDFGRGWQFYDSLDSVHETAQFSGTVKPPLYTGGNLHQRTIILLSEQGFGDTIMFARYATMLAKRGARVVIVTYPDIADLMRTVPGIAQVSRYGEPIPHVHTYARLLNLPRIFGTTLWNIPQQVPYLRAMPSRIDHWKQQIGADGAARRVGLVWAGNPSHSRDVFRSTHLQDLAPLAEVSGITFYSLQKGPRQEEAQNTPPGMRLVDLSSQIQDMSDMAAALQALDLLICVDTAPAHLAGALGRPVWTLLPFAPDWRWMLSRSDSPWYPSMRLFRQPALRDWSGVIRNVRDALYEWHGSANVPSPR